MQSWYLIKYIFICYTDPDVLVSYNHYILEVSQRTLSIRAEREMYPGANLIVGKIEIRGIMSSVSTLLINNVAWSPSDFNLDTTVIKNYSIIITFFLCTWLFS